MIDKNKMVTYETEAMYHNKDWQKLWSFLLSAAMSNSCAIKESEVHGAFHCLKALEKRNIEQNEDLSDKQKEDEKLIVDQFYNTIETRLLENLQQHCRVQIVE